jgi:bacterioferritin-associated ferredoxin
MYVCICKAVTDKQIRQSVGEGVASYTELQKVLSVGLQCGKCCDEAQDILEEAIVESASSRPTVSATVLKLIRA